MNNERELIEKLAIEAGFDVSQGEITVGDYGNRWDVSEQLEAFAKALQSSEPVAIGEVKENGVTWYKQNPHAHPIGTKFFTHPPASVPLEKYNKLLDLLFKISTLAHSELPIALVREIQQTVDSARFAEAEGKER